MFASDIVVSIIKQSYKCIVVWIILCDINEWGDDLMAV